MSISNDINMYQVRYDVIYCLICKISEILFAYRHIYWQLAKNLLDYLFSQFRILRFLVFFTFSRKKIKQIRNHWKNHIEAIWVFFVKMMVSASSSFVNLEFDIRIWHKSSNVLYTYVNSTLFLNMLLSSLWKCRFAWTKPIFINKAIQKGRVGTWPLPGLLNT